MYGRCRDHEGASPCAAHHRRLRRVRCTRAGSGIAAPGAAPRARGPAPGRPRAGGRRAFSDSPNDERLVVEFRARQRLAGARAVDWRIEN